MSSTTTYDSPWKEALERYFPDFMAILFPAIHKDIDWNQGFEFLDEELQQVTRDAELGTRLAGWQSSGVDCYLDEESLVDEFSRRWPGREGAFRKIVERERERSREHLRRMRVQLASLDDRLDGREAELASGMECAPYDSQVERSTYDPHAEPIWQEIERQRDDKPGRRAVARAYSEQLRGLLGSSVPARGLLKASRKRLLNRLYSVSEREGLTLRREAWTAIEEQASRKELLALTLLATIDNQELNSWRWSLHLLESRDLWGTLSELDSG
ncbi:hypothetical protein ACFL59_07620 [Planctomycetota bacterium]